MTRRVLLSLWLSTLMFVSACSLLDSSGAQSETDGVGDEASSPADSGTIVIAMETVPAGLAGSFTVTGVPSGTISADSTLVVTDLAPGTFTTTEIDPAPDFDVSAVSCDDGQQGLVSSGDPQTRTAVINLDAGETVTCTFTNAQRGTAVIAAQTEPGSAAGQLRYTGVPSGTIAANGTLVAANLEPGTYTSTQVDPAPQFDLSEVRCDDGGSVTISSGDAQTRSAVFNIDPGEMVTCTFVNARRGTAIVAVDVDPIDAGGEFWFTGVPSGTVAAHGQLSVPNLSPGTYTTTAVEPDAPYRVASVTCDDGDEDLASSGDPVTRSAIFNIDPGETVTCTYLIEGLAGGPPAGGTGAGGGAGDDGTDGGANDDGRINPFEEPDPDFEDFPAPDDMPSDAGTYDAPRPGTWTATNFEGRLDCDAMSMAMSTEPPETGTIEVLDDGATVIGTGIAEGTSITMTADPEITGRYTGSVEVSEGGGPLTIDYVWQLVTDEYIIGYLTGTVTAEGVTCSAYRPFELRHVGE